MEVIQQAVETKPSEISSKIISALRTKHVFFCGNPTLVYEFVFELIKPGVSTVLPCQVCTYVTIMLK